MVVVVVVVVVVSGVVVDADIFQFFFNCQKKMDKSQCTRALSYKCLHAPSVVIPMKIHDWL